MLRCLPVVDAKLRIVKMSCQLPAQVMPLLFGSIGAEIDFKTIDSRLWPKAVLLVFVGAPPVMLCSSKQDKLHVVGVGMNMSCLFM